MFRDEASIEVIAGKGGDGMSSFRREKYVIKGGPDGGDGGDGGSVLLVASSALNSLLKVGRSYRYSADKGQPGGSRKCTGGRGQSRRVAVPVGTQVFDADEGTLLFDLAHEGDELLVAKGGQGGKGNVKNFPFRFNDADTLMLGNQTSQNLVIKYKRVDTKAIEE